MCVKIKASVLAGSTCFMLASLAVAQTGTGSVDQAGTDSSSASKPDATQANDAASRYLPDVVPKQPSSDFERSLPRVESGRMVDPRPPAPPEPSYRGQTPVRGLDYSAKSVDAVPSAKLPAVERPTVAPADLGKPAGQDSQGTFVPGTTLTLPLGK